MPKYEPPRDDGLKGYLVEISDWRRRYERIIYAATASEARRKGDPRMLGAHVTRVSRKLAPGSSPKGENE